MSAFSNKSFEIRLETEVMKKFFFLRVAHFRGYSTSTIFFLYCNNLYTEETTLWKGETEFRFILNLKLNFFFSKNMSFHDTS